ncbi:NUDIX domain-containing protein [Aeromicrobium sp.]|uniref:NUDIX hydrolase n=1 Tax=Aeromicrobium sp. TaxID=1871063 RepID=UPI003512D17D
MARERPLTAAGAVTWRRCAPRPGSSGKRGVEVLLVHRPRYDDWTFPKGKPDPGEDLVATAVREVAEETAQLVRLGHPLPDTRYRVAGGPKRVSYWAARVVGETATPFTPNREIDDLRWVRPGDARRLLSYEHDLDLLDAFLALRDVKAHRTRTLVVVRHGKAKAREHWRRDDLLRPLTPSGRGRAEALVPLLEAYGVRRVVSSPARRCVDTVAPYAEHRGLDLRHDPRLSEETTEDDVRRAVADVLAEKSPAVVCGHRPTLPWVFEALGLDAPELAPGEGVVLHLRRGVVVADEPLGRPASPR